MSILIWFTALLAGIAGGTWLVIGTAGGGMLYLVVGCVSLLAAVVQARFGVIRLLHVLAESVES